MLTRTANIALIAGFAISSSAAALADPVSDFYNGKTITVNIGFSAGGGFDLYARTVTRHMARHIPGAPRVVAKQMPGGGSFRAAQYMANAAPQDGTQLATFGQSIPLQQVMGDPNATFDVRKFSWIGNPINGVSTIGFWAETGVRTLDDARKKELTVGATGHNVTMQYPLAMNELFGTKLKVILGYPGGKDIELAMERKEVDGKGQFSWSTLKSTRRDWLKDKKVNLVIQLGARKEPEISEYMGYDVPLASELAKTEDDRAVIELLTSGEVIGRPLLTTPGVPAERVAALRGAFDAAMKDSGFLAEADKAGLELNPIGGQQLQDAVNRIMSAKPSAVKRLQAILKKP